MAHLPTYCDACGRAALVPVSELEEGLVCVECGAGPRVIPGSSYGDEDVALFAELASALKEAGITAWQAQLLAARAATTPHPPAGYLLRQLAETLPSLSVLEVGRGAQAMRKADGMLATLLRGFSSGRTQSVLAGVGMPAEQAAAASTSEPTSS
jgi:hypothetical protein